MRTRSRLAVLCAAPLAVAAHSTIRALYAGYAGPLYQIRRSDGQARDIGVLTAGGVADAAAQDAAWATGTTRPDAPPSR